MTPLVVIPARLAARRLPGKPLIDIHGAPMIVHVWQRAHEAAIGPVIVACADREIADVIEAAGGRAVMTAPELPSGSDRVHAAVEALDPEGRYDVVVNLQGDLPAVAPATVAAVLRPLEDPGVDIATLAAPLEPGEAEDTNVVKAILAPGRGDVRRALAFTRSLPRPADDAFHHVGIYAFRRRALRRFVALPPSAGETNERLEQLRALDDGMRIEAALVDAIPYAVDTPDDLARARRLMAPRT